MNPIQSLWDAMKFFRHRTPWEVQAFLAPVVLLVAMWVSASINDLGFIQTIFPWSARWMFRNIPVLALMGLTFPWDALGDITKLNYACESYKCLPEMYRFSYACCVFGLLILKPDDMIGSALCWVRTSFQMWLLLENEEKINGRGDGYVHDKLAVSIFTVTSAEYGVALGKCTQMVDLWAWLVQFNHIGEGVAALSGRYMQPIIMDQPYIKSGCFALHVCLANMLWCGILNSKGEHHHRIWQRCFLWASLMVQIDYVLEYTSWLSLALMLTVVIMTGTAPPLTIDQIKRSFNELCGGHFQM